MGQNTTKQTAGIDLLPLYCPHHCPTVKTLTLTTNFLPMGQWGSSEGEIKEE